jgi:hypothetical protein
VHNIVPCASIDNHSMIFSTDTRQEELPPSGIVSRTAAERERDIQRYTERERQEEAIRRHEAELREQEALKAEARRRRRLEQELAAQTTNLQIEQSNDEQQLQEEGHLHHPNEVQISIPSNISIPSSGGSSPLISPLSSPLKKNGNPWKNTVLKQHVVSPSTVSTAAITKQESSFEDDDSAEEKIEGSHCLPPGGIISVSGSSRVQQFQQQDAKNPRKKSLRLINKSLERSARYDKERIAKLKQRVVNLTDDSDEFAKRSQHWQEKAIDLSMKFYMFEEEIMEKKVDDVFDDDMIRYRQLQNETIESLEKEVEELMMMECIAKEDSICPDEAFLEEKTRLASISLEEEKLDDECSEKKQNLITPGSIEKRPQQRKSLRLSLNLAQVKGSEDFIYQFTCRECSNETYIVSAADTKESLKQTALEIVEQSARLATNKKAIVSESSSTKQDFVQHLASHVPTTIANSEADALMYCKRIIKAEKLKRKKAAGVEVLRLH